MFFKDPQFFIFLLVLPFVGCLFFYFQYRKKILLKKLVNLKIWNQLIFNFSKKQKIINICVQGLILSFMIIALARPFLKDQKIVEKKEGIEIIIAVDVSQSMLVQDVLPSRLSLAKTELSRFLSQSNRKDRIGLIAFAGSSFLISPLTFDVHIIQTYLNSLSTDILTHQGSNFKSAFEMAQRSFEGGGIQDSQKVFILVSDGEEHEAGALEAARDLHEKGVRIFTLGVGTQKGEQILTNSGYLRDRNGNIVVSQFKERSLKEFAQLGNGSFYHLFANSPLVNQLNEDLNLLEKNVFEEDIRQARVEIFQFFLIFSLLLIFFLWIKGYETF